MLNGLFIIALLLIVLGFIFAAWNTYLQRNKEQKGFLQFNKAWFMQRRLEVSRPLAINLWIRNLGGIPTENSYPYFESRLVLVGPEPDIDQKIHSEMLKDALVEYGKNLNSGDKGKTIGAGHGVWLTLDLAKSLTEAQVDEINHGQVRIYIYSWARWRDAPNDLDFCNWLNPPLNGDISDDALIWRVC